MPGFGASCGGAHPGGGGGGGDEGVCGGGGGASAVGSGGIEAPGAVHPCWSLTVSEPPCRSAATYPARRPPGHATTFLAPVPDEVVAWGATASSRSGAAHAVRRAECVRDLPQMVLRRCPDGTRVGGLRCRPDQAGRRKSVTAGRVRKPADAYVVTARTLLLRVHTVAAEAPISLSAAAAATEIAVP